MDRSWTDRAYERGTATLEYVGVAVVVALLAAGIATGGRLTGAGVGDAGGRRLEQAVLAEGRWRDQREVRREGGSAPSRVPRDDLRLTPVFDERAAWSRRWRDRRRIAGIDTATDLRACALCVALEHGHGLTRGATGGSEGGVVGIEAGAEGEGRLALAAADASVHATGKLGPATFDGQGRLRGMLGGEARAAAGLQLGRSVQDLELEAGATAGAVARAEGQLGVDLLGVAIRHGGRVEGWAGAGARGVVGVRRERERLSWRFGWGAALGLGGAAEWQGSVDISAVSPRHRRLARDALATAARVAIGLPITVRNRHEEFHRDAHHP